MTTVTYVTIPFTGTVSVALRDIDPTDKDAVWEAAMGAVAGVRFNTDKAPDAEIDSWEFCPTVVEGNVFCGVQNKWEIGDTETDDDDE